MRYNTNKQQKGKLTVSVSTPSLTVSLAEGVALTTSVVLSEVDSAI